MKKQIHNMSKGSGVSSTDSAYIRERRMFRLLLQSNTNYFGTAAASVLPAKVPICCNTYYEDIACVVWDREAHVLVAILTLHQAEGYAGGTRLICAPEYLRFYISLDGGTSWKDQGQVRVEVQNAGENRDRNYAASIAPTLSREDMARVDVRVRVILAWDHVPPADQPEWKPVFGNVHETQLHAGAWYSGRQEPAAGTRLSAGLGGRHGTEVVAVASLSAADAQSARYRCLSLWVRKGDAWRCLGTCPMPDEPGYSGKLFRLPLDMTAYRRICARQSTLVEISVVLSSWSPEVGSSAYPEQDDLLEETTCLTIPPMVVAGAGEIALVGGRSVRDIHVPELLLDELEDDEILIQGVPRPGCSYVVEVSDDGLNWQPLLQDIRVMDQKGQRSRHAPAPESGHFAYLAHEKNVLGILARWRYSRLGKWYIRLRVYMKGVLLPEPDQVVVRLGENGGASVLNDMESVEPERVERRHPGLLHSSLFSAGGMVIV